jgi:hypothetical protein
MTLVENFRIGALDHNDLKGLISILSTVKEVLNNMTMFDSSRCSDHLFFSHPIKCKVKNTTLSEQFEYQNRRKRQH